VRLLGGPSTRNAQAAEEMLTPNVIYGESAEGAPRLTYAKPETRYRMALDRTAPNRPLANYENPVRDQMYVAPEEMRPFSAGEVRTPVDPIAALNTETTVPVSNAPKWADVRLKEAQRAEEMMNEGGVWPTQQRTLRRLAGESEDAFRARQLAIMEEEGGGAGRQATLNNLDRQAEADFRARQMGALDDESGAITSGRNPPNRVARALQLTERQPPAAPPEFVGPPEMQGPRQITPGNFIGPAERQGPPELIGPRQTPQIPLLEQLQNGQISGRQYQAALDAQRSAVAPAAPAPFAPPNAINAQRSSLESLIATEENRRLAMQRTQAQRDALATAIGDASMERTYGAGQGPLLAPAKGSNTGALILGGSLLPAAAVITGSQQYRLPEQVAGSAPANPNIKTVNGVPVYTTAPSFDINSNASPDYAYSTPAEILGSRRATAAATDSAYAPVGASPAPATAPQQAIQTARSLQARQADARSLIEGKSAPMSRPSDGFLSNLFANRPASTKQLFEQSQTDPSDSGAWMRAERQYAKSHPDAPNFDVTQLNESGMKRGGAANAKPGKDEAVHKALDIIQHLLMRH
jgi:hypothetical protein